MLFRSAAMVQGLAGLGAEVEELDDGLIVKGPCRISAGSVRTFSDHRIAMSFAILSRALDLAIELDDPSCVSISYPGFFKDMETLG